jgi:uncharacterized protein YegP (UPF0339 family)
MAERVELYRDREGGWRWRRVAVNEEVIAESGEGYVNKLHAVRMAAQLNPDTVIVEVAESAEPAAE